MQLVLLILISTLQQQKRKIRLDSEIINMSWKVKWEDITFPHLERSRASSHAFSMVSERLNSPFTNN